MDIRVSSSTTICWGFSHALPSLEGGRAGVYFDIAAHLSCKKPSKSSLGCGCPPGDVDWARWSLILSPHKPPTSTSYSWYAPPQASLLRTPLLSAAAITVPQYGRDPPDRRPQKFLADRGPKWFSPVLYSTAQQDLLPLSPLPLPPPLPSRCRPIPVNLICLSLGTFLSCPRWD